MYITVLNITRGLIPTSDSLINWLNKCWLGLIFDPAWDSDDQQKYHSSVGRPERSRSWNCFNIQTEERLWWMIQNCDSVPCHYVATRNQRPQNLLRTEPDWKILRLSFSVQAVQGSTANIARPTDDSKDAISSSVRGSVPLFFSYMVCLRHSLGLRRRTAALSWKCLCWGSASGCPQAVSIRAAQIWPPFALWQHYQSLP